MCKAPLVKRTPNDGDIIAVLTVVSVFRYSEALGKRHVRVNVVSYRTIKTSLNCQLFITGFTFDKQVFPTT